MKTKMKNALMTVSVLVVAVAAGPAFADPTVMCSIKAQYQGGVSVDGTPVAPADIAPNPAQTVRIPLTIDLAQRMDAILPEGMKLEAQTGLIDILGNGHVLFNGKDLTGPANVLCSNLAKEKAAALKTKDVPKKAKKRRAADVPANVEDEVKAQPVEPVAAETVPEPEPAPVPSPAPEAVSEPAEPAPAPEPAPEPAPTPEPAPVEAAPAPEPQVLQPLESAPVAEPAPASAPEPAPAQAPAPAPEMPPQPSEILSPTEGGMIPRPPTDPFAPPAEAEQEGAAENPAPEPAPAPDEMLSGGGQ